MKKGQEILEQGSDRATRHFYHLVGLSNPRSDGNIPCVPVS
jgi:hypothetical protein